MKYSLRSLMTFSIRDLLLLTVIVALAVGWGVDHWNEEAAKTRLQDDATELANHISWYDPPERIERLLQKHQSSYREKSDKLPNSSAPAPNPPKP